MYSYIQLCTFMYSYVQIYSYVQLYTVIYRSVLWGVSLVNIDAVALARHVSSISASLD